jgi:dienelactone hydrolase
MLSLLLSLLCPLTVATAAPAQADPTEPGPDLFGTLAPGPHAVGLRVTDVEVPAAAPATPLAFAHGYRLFVWYPAEDAAGSSPVTLARMYELMEETPPDRGQLRGWLREDVGLAADADVELDPWLDASLRATLDAGALEGARPLVLWSARHGIPTSQAPLCEHLASHGYVVAWVWPLGPTPPMPWEGHPRALLQETLEGYVDLLSRALDHLLALEQVDAEGVVVAAWSYGGESATLLQAQRPEVDGLLSLSSTTLDTLFGAEAPDAATLRSRLVYVTQLRGERGGASSSWSPLLRDPGVRCHGIRFEGIHHGDFDFLTGSLAARIGGDGHARWSVGGEQAIRGYESIARCARSAVAHLLGETAELDASWTEGLEAGSVTIEDFSE